MLAMQPTLQMPRIVWPRKPKWFSRRRRIANESFSDVESQVGSSTISTRLTSLGTSATATSTAPTSHTGIGAASSASSASPQPRINCIDGTFIMPDIPIPADILHEFEENIHDKLAMDLDGVCREACGRLTGQLVELSFASNTNTEWGKTAIILSYEKGNKGQRMAIEKYISTSIWLRNFRDRYSVPYFLLSTLPVMTASHNSSDSYPGMQTATGVVRLSQGTGPIAGSTVHITAEHRQTCGGWVLLDGYKLLIMTARHGFDDSGTSVEILRNVEKQVHTSGSASWASQLPDLVAQKVVVQIRLHTEDSFFRASKRTLQRSFVTAFSGQRASSQGGSEAKHLAATAYFPKKPAAIRAVTHVKPDYDWALLYPVSRSDLLQRAGMLRSDAEPRLSKGAYSDAKQPEGSVSIEISGSGHRWGILSMSKASLRLRGSFYDVRRITFDDVLPPGSSGAWVDHEGYVCGFIIAARQDVPWAYMVPIHPVLQDMRITLGTSDVRIPTADEVQHLLRDETPEMENLSFSALSNSDMARSKCCDGSALMPGPITKSIMSTDGSTDGNAPGPTTRHDDVNVHSTTCSVMTTSTTSRRLARSSASNLSAKGWLPAKDELAIKNARFIKTQRWHSLRRLLWHGAENGSTRLSHRACQNGTIFTEGSSRPNIQSSTRDIRVALRLAWEQTELQVVDPFVINIAASPDVQFQSIVDCANQVLRNNGYSSRYLALGSYRLLRTHAGATGILVSSGQLEDELQWRSILLRDIGNFHLTIDWSFEELPVPLEADEPYASTVRNAIYEKMQKNWEEENYISKSDLEGIFKPSVIGQLLKEDHTIERPPDLAILRKDVHQSAIKLMAVFIYTRLSLKFMVDLMNGGITDKHMPLNKTHCPDAKHRLDWDYFMFAQWSFSPHEFIDTEVRPRHYLMEPKTIIPIHVRDRIGRGGFGEVFRVTIRPEHHHFSSLNHDTFALKRFYDLGMQTSDAFQREARMLKAISTSAHGHIVSHLASWTRQDKFYILFPLASNNLKDFLRQTHPPNFDREFVLWILTQLEGLADALRKIHNLGDELPLTKKPLHTGFHHDLKPENILVFGAHAHAQLKISDFGSGRIGRVLSGSSGISQESYFTNQALDGDPAYGAPESYLGQISRPYDIWSLGCIYLEILLWTFGHDLEQFNFDRLTTYSRCSQRLQSANFWCESEKNKIELKPAVKQALLNLEGDCTGFGMFDKLLGIIRRMLTISVVGRITAAGLRTCIDVMRIQAELDLGKDPNLYLKSRKREAKEGLSAESVSGPPSDFTDCLSSISDYETVSIDSSSVQSMFSER